MIDGPWLATRDYFHTEGDCLNTVDVATYIRQLSHNPADPVAAKLAGFLGIDRTSPAVRDRQMWSVIATVPDPLHTRMTLTLDTQIEAIERSLQAAGWEFANQWMPWNDRFDGGEKDIGQRRRQRHLQALGEAMPGILIFRARPKNQDFPKRVLFVLLVPETATSGIAWRPFVSALNLASALILFISGFSRECLAGETLRRRSVGPYGLQRFGIGVRLRGRVQDDDSPGIPQWRGGYTGRLPESLLRDAAERL